MTAVVQVSFHLDALRRSGVELLEAWPTLPSVAIAARAAGVNVSVVQAAHEDAVIDREGVRFHFVAARTHDRASVIARVASLQPGVVHVQGFGFPRQMRPLARALAGVPIVVQDHGSVPPSGWRRAAWRWAYHGIAGVTFTAREQAMPWIRAGIVRPGTPVFEVIEGSSCFTPGDRAAARRATGMTGSPCMLWTGRLDANKDPFTMLDAFERAAHAMPHARLWCCHGDAPLLDAVRDRIASSAALSERVTLLGTRPHAELEDRYRAAEFFVQTSHREGSGYSIIEALACGATPLVTDIPSARAIVGSAGSLTPVGDAVALGNAMISWASRDRDALRSAARARFDACLSFETIGAQLRDVYRDVARATFVPATSPLEPATLSPAIR